MLYKFWKVPRSRGKCFTNFGKSRAAVRNALQILESPAQPWKMLYKFWKVPRSRGKCFTNFGKVCAAVRNALQILEKSAQPWEMLYKFWKGLRSRCDVSVNFPIFIPYRLPSAQIFVLLLKRILNEIERWQSINVFF